MAIRAFQSSKSNCSRHVLTYSGIATAGISIIQDDFHLSLSLGYRRNQMFTGRDDHLRTLHELLSGHQTNSTVVVVGIGGLGKTQVVREYAYRFSHEYTSIVWFDCHSLETVQTSFLQLAQRLVRHYANHNSSVVPPYSQLAQHLSMAGAIDTNGHVKHPVDNKSLVVDAVHKWFGQKGNAGWLVVFDNYDDVNSEQFSDGRLFPETSENGKILVTTRRRECARFGRLLEMDTMSEEESLELLEKSCRAGCKSADFDTAEALDIVKTLGHLPLAIDQAGAYILTMGVPLSSYLPLLRGPLIRQTLSRKPSVGWQYSESVFTTWEISFQRLEKTQPRAAELLLLCAYLSNEDIEIELLRLYIAAYVLQESIGELSSFSLIKLKVTGAAFSIHPLVHAWARERLDSQTRSDLVGRASSVVSRAVTPSEIWTTGVRTSQDWILERSIVAHVENLSRWLNEICKDDQTYFKHSQQWMTMANVHFYQGRYDRASHIYSRIIAARDLQFEPSDADTLMAVQAWATIKRFQGDWTNCEALYNRALSHRTQQDPNHLDTLATVQSLAILYRHQGRLEESVKLYEWALHGKDGCGYGMEEQQGPTHPNTIHTVFGLAIVLQKQGKHHQALGLYERVLGKRTIDLGDLHPDTLTVKHNTATVLCCLGELAHSQRLFEDVLPHRERTLGPDHPDTLRTIDSMATLFHEQGNFELAEKHYMLALEGRRQKLGPAHPDTLESLHNLATNNRVQGRLKVAKSMYLEALQGRQEQKKFDPENLEVLRTVEGLGLVAEAQREHREALELLSRALDGYTKALAQHSTEVTRTTDSIGRVLEKEGRKEEARSYYRRLSSTESTESTESRTIREVSM
ncbi:hypothetical protein E4T38_09763 [Aureobasidium subglaciale]|nr:hypothetical protein E4T38_09763 [Aureobasidium subglaciale]KAI5213440.1 hypothetical protein E4T40_09725 [Aureobasidium subglaciale]KAI5214968.1 hypothetical protein E4T41_09764 [Aureobasidium subglaciale]KAI5253006.1 hypothetical protein E4T46_09739 [Aureobasidium subglaciale]